MKYLPAALAAVGIALATTVPSFAESKLSSSDEAFVKKAAQGGLIEVKLGEIAATKAKRDDVKAFGTQMVTDHTQANTELKALATAKGVPISDELEAKNVAMVNKMSKLEGDAFDGAYVKDMVKDHEMDVKDFEKAANSAKDPDVKAFAAKTLPTLKSHLQHIQEVLGKK